MEGREGKSSGKVGATQNDWYCGSNRSAGKWRRRRCYEGQDKGKTEGTAKGGREWRVGDARQGGRRERMVRDGAEGKERQGWAWNGLGGIR